MWHRVHTKPRKSLFTPFKVAKGPSSDEKLNVVRFTKGVTQSGHKFEFHDNWHKSQNSHRILDEPWIGYTSFVVEGRASLLGVQRDQHQAGECLKPDNKHRWSDVLPE